MATKKKLLQAAAGNAGGAGLNVEDVFSTYIYKGNNSTQTITNGIDLSGEGGLVWIKNRSTSSTSHCLFDSESGATGGKRLRTNLTNGIQTFNGSNVFTTSSTGFALNNDASNDMNDSTYDYVSWSFLKSKRFFDIQTWTGDGTNNRKISHNLGSVPGCYIVKQTNDGRSWNIYHRGVNGGTNPENYIMSFTTDAQADVDYWNDTAPTATEFTINNYAPLNESGGNYVAYLFAHNDGDGGFGPDGDADIIKCGSYSNSGSAWSVDLGFEPQFLIRKLADGTSDWQITDTMRGLFPKGQNAKNLTANTSNAENNAAGIQITPTGIEGTGNGASGTWIYIAIRRGTAVPESATDVFAISDRKNEIPSFPSGFPVDFLIGPRTINGTDNNEVKTRLISGGYLRTNTTGAETSSDQSANFAHNDGFFNFSGANANQYSWMWRRAPKYMECVAYFGNSTAGRTVQHGLTVTPEMMWVKRRNSATDWRVYHKDIGNTHNLQLNSTAAKEDALYWNDTTPTDSVFTLNNFGDVNGSSNTYIAYLFATLAGISKVGSVTQSGTTNVDCGFTSGARFVLLKRTDATGDWYVWDSERGIVAGNDPYLLLNSSAAQVSVQDYIAPLASGFTITSNFDFGDYIFYAIA